MTSSPVLVPCFYLLLSKSQTGGKLAASNLADALLLAELLQSLDLMVSALSGRRNALNQTGASSVRLWLSSGTSTVTGRSKQVLHLSNFSRTN